MEVPQVEVLVVEEEMLTVLDVARVLKVARNTVYVLIYSGALESVKIGACRRIRREALREYIEGLRESGRVA
jgi:excisionase family DNA binding protein